MLNQRILKNREKKIRKTALAAIISAVFCGMFSIKGEAVVNRSAWTAELYPTKYLSAPDDTDWWYLDNEGYLFYGQNKKATGNKDMFNGQKDFINTLHETSGAFKEDKNYIGIEKVIVNNYTDDIAVSLDNKYIYGIGKDGVLLIGNLEKVKSERRFYNDKEINSEDYKYVAKDKTHMIKNVSLMCGDAFEGYYGLSVDSNDNLLVACSEVDNPIIYRIEKSKIEDLMNSDENYIEINEGISPSLRDMKYSDGAKVEDMTNMSVNGISDYLLLAITDNGKTELVLFNPPVDGKYTEYKKIGSVVMEDGSDVEVTGITTVNRKIYLTTPNGAYTFEKTPNRDNSDELSKHKLVPLKFVLTDREGNRSYSDKNIAPKQKIEGPAIKMNLTTGTSFTGAASGQEGNVKYQADPYNDFKLNHPEKTLVKDRKKVTSEEKEKIKDAIMKVNKELEREKIIVKDDGGVSYTKEIGKDKGKHEVTDEISGYDVVIEEVFVKAPKLTKVKNKNNLSEIEKENVKKAIFDINKKLREINKENKVEIIVDNDGYTSVDVKESEKHSSKYVIFKQHETVIQIPEKTEVVNKNKLSEEEKKAVENKIKEANKEIKIVSNKDDVKENEFYIEVDSRGNAKVKNDGDEIVAEFTQEETVLNKQVEPKVDDKKEDGKSEDKKEDEKSEDKKEDGKSEDKKEDSKPEDKKEDEKSEDKKDETKPEDKKEDGKSEDKKDETKPEDKKEDIKSEDKKDDTKSEETIKPKNNRRHSGSSKKNKVKKNNEKYDGDKNKNDRIAGENRFSTAAKVSAIGCKKADVVILANGMKYTDVLTAVPYAHELNCSILYTNADSIPEETKNDMKRMGISKVIIIGGVDSVSSNVEKELKNMYAVERLSGIDRYATAESVAIRVRSLSNIKNKAIMTSGENYPDALSISSLATKENIPILITKKDSMPIYTSRFISDNKISNIVFAGGLSSVGSGIEKESEKLGVSNAVRYAGKDRYETSAVIAEKIRGNARYALYASGEDFADALVAGVLGGKMEAPTLLVQKNELPQTVKNSMKHVDSNNRVLIGGPNSISEKVRIEIKNIK